MALARLLLLLLSLAAWGQALAAARLTLAELAGPGFSARGVALDLPDGGGPARLSVTSLRLAGREQGPLAVSCPSARLAALRLDCPAGRLEVGGLAPHFLSLPLSLSLDLERGEVQLELAPDKGERWRLAGNWRRGEGSLELENARTERLAALAPVLAAWQPRGQVSGRLALARNSAGRAVDFDLSFTALAFGNAAGSLAMDRAGGRLAGRAEEARDGGWAWRLSADWREGEGYFAPVYLPSGGLKLAATGSLKEGALDVHQARLGLAGIGALDFSGRRDADGAIRAASFSGQGLELSRGGELLLAPWLEQARLPKLGLGGKLDLSGDWREGQLDRLDVTVTGGSLRDPEERFALSDLELRLPWRRDGTGTGAIRFSGGRFQRLPFGAASLSLVMNGLDFSLARTEIPLLDGALVLDGGRASRKEGRWRWQMAASLYPVSMELLTRALGLPPMAGRLSADIPRVHSEGEVVAMDGMLVIQVFDGFLAVNGLSLTDPFGRAPVLRAASVDIRHLDLGQLTHTFSFGEITGYLDGDIDGLELVHWQPQRFDASFASSPGDYRRRISQRAVQNISSLGGAGAGAAIQRSFLSLLDTFGYRRIGLSCRLRNGVCLMGGVAPAPRGYVLVEGGGVPALSVIGYNPAVDWGELVSRLKAAVAGNARPVVR